MFWRFLYFQVLPDESEIAHTREIARNEMEATDRGPSLTAVAGAPAVMTGHFSV